MPETNRLWKAHELLGSVPVALWAGLHLWEQWAAFGGWRPFVSRMMGTSHGGLAVGVELTLAVLPALGWIGLELWLRLTSEEPEALRLAMAEDARLARRLGLIARVGSWVFFGWLVLHVGWLWWPKLTEGSDPLRTWIRLREGMGTWPQLILQSLGLTGLLIHLSAAVPRLLVALGWAPTPSSRRAARLSGLVVALGLLCLYAQLAGWHAAGAGTIWSLHP